MSTVGPCGLRCIKMVLEKKGADAYLILSSDSYFQSFRSKYSSRTYYPLKSVSEVYMCTHTYPFYQITFYL